MTFCGWQEDSKFKIREIFQDIHATEFAFRWAMMAYNLMSYVRNAIAVSKVKHTLPTLKFRCIAIGAYLVSTGRQKKLMLAVSLSKHDYIDSLFQKIKKYKPQLEQSTAYSGIKRTNQTFGYLKGKIKTNNTVPKVCKAY